MHIPLLVFGILVNTAQSRILPLGPACSNITIPVSTSSPNAQIDASVQSQFRLFNVKQSISSGAPELTDSKSVRGQYNIKARYCEPEVQISSRSNTIQLLVHGITYDRNYWSGLGEPGAGFDGDTYSWVAYASKQGYPTLSIDRLGNGESDRPNGLTVVQMSSHVEVTQSLINSLKDGSIGGRAFDDVIYVGHWYGSLIGNIHAVKYPNAVNTYVLTGFSYKIKPSLAPTLLSGGFIPARLAYPEKWGNQSSFYFAASKEEGTGKLFFVNETVDPELAKLNYKLRGTVTAGEFISAYKSTQVAKDYRGRVYVLTGQNDAIFCSPDPFGRGTLTGQGDCGTGEDSIIERTRDLYPAASVYDYDTPANTGHCNILQYNAQEQFETVHNWLGQFY
ncbi:hypothetical protein K3495_g6673 [Podosphaera aphanis]|nr:hypothetical protein K3495_g6673 [Podosphaera aphanis]